MSDLINEIRRAQMLAGERAVVASLVRQGLVAQTTPPRKVVDHEEALRLARVALQECPYPGHDHPNDWSDAAMAVCRYLVADAAVSAPQPITRR